MKKGLGFYAWFNLGTITLILSVLLAVAIHSFTSFDVMSFSVFYIIPMGRFVLAQSHVWVLFGLVCKQQKSLSQSIYDWFVNSYLSYIRCSYGYYVTAYLDEDMNLNYKMVGEHISNYAIGDSEEPLNFISFTKLW